MRERNVPDRLELSNMGKSYANAVVHGLRLGGGKGDASEPDGRQVPAGRSVQRGGGHKDGPLKVSV